VSSMAQLKLRDVDRLNKEVSRLQEMVGKLVRQDITQDAVFTVKEIRVLITEAIENLVEECPQLDEDGGI
jgi:flagella basal body P-ring formation protein FlgA